MRLAGITGQTRGAAEVLLTAVAERLTNDGVRLVGALCPAIPDGGSGHCNSDLWLLPRGPLMRITQDLGQGSTACRMDASAFEEAVGQITSRLQAGAVDLVLLNKFGLQEAEGRGLRPLIAEALDKGVPVLTGVPETHRASFAQFAGGMDTHLPPEEDAILAWCRRAIAPNATQTKEL
ncbi:DUF2478 domain-containing protein [Pseudophaeobacter flagellatus]|uniref:DUF2478 domain-containing protein n=1 Tax=Pseudophaeobacter flagellatus TaxID=2899119 RepID=UPI001E41EB48|nr:DUF2478 domain-containing protein [Pseudophaeobacter flagellatus]MCD9149060.1 DUF2478 domain-containing protein [Pseudophaeobacter flagellatus]